MRMIGINEQPRFEQPAQIERLLSVKEAADFLGVTPDAVYRWVRAQRLPCLRAGNRIRFVRAELLQRLGAEGKEASMPRLPKILVKRGNSYYYRSREGGRDVRISLGTDREEARRRALLMALGQFEVPPQTGVQPEPITNCPTLSEFSKIWLTEYVRQSRNADGVELARRRLEKHMVPALGSVPLDQISPTLLRGFRSELEAKKLAALTVRHLLSDLRCLLQYAVESEVLTKSPFRSSVMPRIPEAAPRALSEDELTKVLAATPERFLTAVNLAVLTGLRWGELRRLQWRHVVSEGSPHLVLDKTKSGKVRRVPLLPAAIEVLEDEKRRTRSVFVLPYRPEHTQVFVVPMREQLGFYWTFHQLRHTFACRWLDAGGSKEALQKILGHSTIAMTERYGRLSDDAVFAEAKGLSVGRPVKWAQGTGTGDDEVESKRIVKTS